MYCVHQREKQTHRHTDAQTRSHLLGLLSEPKIKQVENWGQPPPLLPLQRLTKTYVLATFYLYHFYMFSDFQVPAITRIITLLIWQAMSPLLFFHYHNAFKKFLKTHVRNSLESIWTGFQEHLRRNNKRKMMKNPLMTTNLVTHKSQNLLYTREMQTHKSLTIVEV